MTRNDDEQLPSFFMLCVKVTARMRRLENNFLTQFCYMYKRKVTVE